MALPTPIAYDRLEAIEDLERCLAHVQWLAQLTRGQGLQDDPTGWLDVAARSVYRELLRARRRSETVDQAEAIRRRVLAAWRADAPADPKGAEYGPDLVPRAGIRWGRGADLVADAGTVWDGRIASVELRPGPDDLDELDAPAGAGDAVEAYRG